MLELVQKCKNDYTKQFQWFTCSRASCWFLSRLWWVKSCIDSIVVTRKLGLLMHTVFRVVQFNSFYSKKLVPCITYFSNNSLNTDQPDLQLQYVTINVVNFTTNLLSKYQLQTWCPVWIWLCILLESCRYRLDVCSYRCVLPLKSIPHERIGKVEFLLFPKLFFFLQTHENM